MIRRSHFAMMIALLPMLVASEDPQVARLKSLGLKMGEQSGQAWRTKYGPVELRRIYEHEGRIVYDCGIIGKGGILEYLYDLDNLIEPLPVAGSGPYRGA